MDIRKIDENNYNIQIGKPYNLLNINIKIYTESLNHKAIFSIGSARVKNITGDEPTFKEFLDNNVKPNLLSLVSEIRKNINDIINEFDEVFKK
jgi:hypothetical protein